jgi:hypothetical protein
VIPFSSSVSESDGHSLIGFLEIPQSIEAEILAKPPLPHLQPTTTPPRNSEVGSCSYSSI